MYAAQHLVLVNSGKLQSKEKLQAACQVPACAVGGSTELVSM